MIYRDNKSKMFIPYETLDLYWNQSVGRRVQAVWKMWIKCAGHIETKQLRTSMSRSLD